MQISRVKSISRTSKNPGTQQSSCLVPVLHDQGFSSSSSLLTFHRVDNHTEVKALV